MYHRRERTTEDGMTTENSHVDFLKNLIVDATLVFEIRLHDYRPVASNVQLVRPRSCGTMRIIYAKINHSESARF